MSPGGSEADLSFWAQAAKGSASMLDKPSASTNLRFMILDLRKGKFSASLFLVLAATSDCLRSALRSQEAGEKTGTQRPQRRHEEHKGNTLCEHCVFFVVFVSFV